MLRVRPVRSSMSERSKFIRSLTGQVPSSSSTLVKTDIVVDNNIANKSSVAEAAHMPYLGPMLSLDMTAVARSDADTTSPRGSSLGMSHSLADGHKVASSRVAKQPQLNYISDNEERKDLNCNSVTAMQSVFSM